MLISEFQLSQFLVLLGIFPNSDASDVRREFQKAAATALAKPKPR